MTPQVEKDRQDAHRSREKTTGGEPKNHQTYVVLDFPAGVGVDGEPSLLVLGLDVGVLGRQGVLDLQAGRHAGNLAVAGVCQHSGQFHQEGRLRREPRSAPTPARASPPTPGGKKSPFTQKNPKKT